MTSTRGSMTIRLAKATPRLRRHLAILGACAGACLGIAGCGGSTPSVQPHGPKYEVTTAAVGGLGTVLVDGQGFTLYLFIPDDRSSHSTCDDICAVAWPPLIVPGGKTPIAGHGLKASLLGTTTRAGGVRQVTYDGWPLYLWANDGSPGQATGEGLNNLGGLWYAVNAKGSPVRS